MRNIYLDNSATTPLSECVKAAMCEAMECFGNPSSLHPIGQSANRLLEQSRRSVMQSLGLRSMSADAGRLIFTAGGTEADNLAILGTAYAKARRRGGRIICTDSEHAGVEKTMQALEADGFEVVRISTRAGVLDLEQYRAALTPSTFLVSMMMVNNETGALYDVARAFSMAKAVRPDIVTHTDAVQGYLKCRFTPQSIKADLVTVSSHKIHGPKGVGALYVSAEALKRRDLTPTALGGGQEGGFRSGTENLIGIAGFGAAAQEGFRTLASNLAHMTDLRDYARARLSELPVVLNLPAGNCAPHIVNVTVPDIRSETLLHALSTDGIYVSNGAACSSHGQKSNSPLLAFGLTQAQMESAIRISFSGYNTREDVDALIDALARAIPRLVHTKR
jgi:cysteine desulfurase